LYLGLFLAYVRYISKQRGKTSDELIHGLLSNPQIMEFPCFLIEKPLHQISFLENILGLLSSYILFTYTAYNLDLFPP